MERESNLPNTLKMLSFGDRTESQPSEAIVSVQGLNMRYIDGILDLTSRTVPLIPFLSDWGVEGLKKKSL